REEVVNGELQVLPPSKYTHAEIVHNLSFAISSRIDKKRVQVLESSLSLLIRAEPLIARAPDLVVCWREKIVRDENDVLASAPDLIIEVLSLSETKRRKETKMNDYASICVPEVWIVSREAETVEIRLLSDGKLFPQKIIAEGTLEPTRFPGVSIPIAEIWPE